MTGQKFKEVIISCTGLQFCDIARKLGVTSAAFDSTCKSPDVKSSYIERAVEIFNIPPAKFFMPIEETKTRNEDLIDSLLMQNKMLIEQNQNLTKILTDEKRQ